MKASPVINSICLLSSLRQRGRLRWEKDSEASAGGMAKGPGGCWAWRKENLVEGLHELVFRNSKAVI